MPPDRCRPDAVQHDGASCWIVQGSSRVNSRGRALALPTRDGVVRGAARHGQSKAQLDEQPAGPASGCLDRTMAALFGARSGAGSGASPVFCDAIPDQHFKYSWVIVAHGTLFSQELLSQEYFPQELLSNLPVR